jgi:hypothetical protein
VLSWPDGALADMDTLLMNAGVVDPLIAASLFISTTADEVMIAPVDPGSYWVWAATYDDAVAPTLPVSYDITICAF